MSVYHLGIPSPDLFPFLLSLILTLSVAIFTYRRRSVLGARSFSIVIFIELFQTGCYILELVSPDLPGKMFWDNVQWFTTLLFPVCVLFFAHEYVGKLRWVFYRWIWLLAGVSVLLSTLITLNVFPGQGILAPRLVIAEPFSLYVYEFGPLLLGASIYSYVLALAGLIVLGWELTRQSGIYRVQTAIILLGLLIPIAGTALVLLGIDVLPNRDISPLTFSLADIFIAVGLFRYKIFDILPIARSSVMDLIADPVVILDNQDGILDANPAFTDLLKVSRKDLIRKPVQQFLPSLQPITLVNSPQHTDLAEECVVKNNQASAYFEISSKPFTNRIGIYGGRMLVLHDITRRKDDETQLRLSHDVLEQRVSERTRELQNSNQLLTQEIGERKRAEQEKITYAQEMEDLYQLALELSELPPEKPLEEFFAYKLKEQTNAIFISLAQYNPLEKRLEIRQLLMSSQFLNKIVELIGGDPREVSIPVSDAIYQHIVREEVVYLQNLSSATFGAISNVVGTTLQTIVKVDQFIGLGILYNGELEATVLIGLQKGHMIPSQRFLKAFTKLIAGAFWRKKAELARQESESRFQQMANLLPQGIFECTQDGIITYANLRAAEMFQYPGFTPGEHFLNLFAEEKREMMQEIFRTALTGFSSGQHEFQVARRDGSLFPALIYASVVIKNGQTVGLRGVIVDITELKQAEQNLQRSNRFLRATSRCNLALVHAPDSQTLFNEICTILVDEIGYSFAWIGLLNDGARLMINPAASFGIKNIPLAPVDISKGLPALEFLPMLEAIQRQEAVVISDIISDPRCLSIWQQAETMQLKSAMSLPLSYSGNVFGGITVYASHQDAFSPDEVKVLLEMSSDVAFGIHILQVRKDRDHAIMRLEEVNQKLSEAYDATLLGWSLALELRERETAGHSQRVVRLTLLLAEKMGVPAEKLIDIRWGAYLHDIGKIGIPDSILLKPEPLMDDEWQVMRQHPVFAYRLISSIAFLKGAGDIPYLHHERWDGSGYPLQLKGEEIPLAARIFMVVDVWDALVYDRPYRSAWSAEKTRGYLHENAGILFDPKAVTAFLELLDAEGGIEI